MNLRARFGNLTTILWIVASLVAFGAFIFIAPTLLNSPPSTVTPTTVSNVVSTASPTATIGNTVTPPPIAPPAVEATREPLPTAPPDAVTYVSVADPTRSGYIRALEEMPHWGDRNLHAGFFGNDRYAGVLFFDISALPPNSEILSADLEVAGLSRDNLGEGEWRAALVRLKSFEDWEELTTADLFDATMTTSIGRPLVPSELELGRVNDFRFAEDQLFGLANDVDAQTFLVVRLEGPSGPDNSLFTWDSGGLDLNTGTHPTLSIVARPGQFVVVTNTPTPENVVTAAAIVVAETEFAAQFGTPTAFPRSYATGTPIHYVTREPTALNVQTRVAVAQIATAIAQTTGTYTPTPENWIEITPTWTPAATRTPEAIPVATLIARSTPLAPRRNTPTVRELLAMPLPAYLQGNLLIKSNRFGETMILVMTPDGTITQGLTGDMYYDVASSREPFSPDRTQRAVVTADERGILQIFIEDQNTFDLRRVTNLSRGLAYDPVWSPDGGRIAFVGREFENDEIFVYDLGTGTTTQLTSGGNAFIYKQKPTWSPDGSQIAFKSNEGSLNFQIWVMNADGSGLHNISQSESIDMDPIWVK